MGVSTTACQVFIPFAAQLAKEEERGKVVGSMMGGLLTGILLSRTLSGLVAQELGWRGVYYVASGLMVLMALILAGVLPSEKPAFKGSYRELMASLWHLLRSQPVIRQRFTDRGIAVWGGICILGYPGLLFGRRSITDIASR